MGFMYFLLPNCPKLTAPTAPKKPMYIYVYIYIYIGLNKTEGVSILHQTCLLDGLIASETPSPNTIGALS